jgi:hypothetical protein
VFRHQHLCCPSRTLHNARPRFRVPVKETFSRFPALLGRISALRCNLSTLQTRRLCARQSSLHKLARETETLPANHRSSNGSLNCGSIVGRERHIFRGQASEPPSSKPGRTVADAFKCFLSEPEPPDVNAPDQSCAQNRRPKTGPTVHLTTSSRPGAARFKAPPHCERGEAIEKENET